MVIDLHVYTISSGVCLCLISQHDHPYTFPCGSVTNRTHPCQGRRPPIVEIEIKQAVAKTEL